MKKYKLFFKIFFVLYFASNLFVDVSGEYLEKKDKNEDKNIAYLGLEKKASNEKEYLYITGNEKKVEKELNEKDEANGNGVFSVHKILGNKKSVQYNITGIENKFSLSDKELKNIYNIDGTEKVKYSKKLLLTKYQKAQIEYLEMERNCKTLVLDNEINLKKKMLNEELARNLADVFLIDELSKEIKLLAVDKETVDINVDKKIRYVLTQEQYLEYKQKNKKNKKI